MYYESLNWGAQVCIKFQAMTDSMAMKKRVLKYLIPGFLLSFIFNIPKFFEAEVIYKFQNGTEEDGANYVSLKYRFL